MLDAARAIESVVTGARTEDYARNRQRQYADERALENVGVAARRVSGPLRGAIPTEEPRRRVSTAIRWGRKIELDSRRQATTMFEQRS